MKNKIREYRETNRITQDQLATMTNVSRQTIISLEKFKYVASLQLAWKLSKVFGVKIEDLFCFEEEDLQ
jgi:putative transcriptional regulator